MACVRLLSPFLLVLLGSYRANCVEESYDEDSQSTDTVVRKFWGIQDTSTSVGKLFRYKIPADAFKGTIVRYEVRGEEEKALPKWMIFDEGQCMLEGVPSVNDIGDVRINVKAYDSKGNFVADMFIVEVYPLFEKDASAERKCKKGEEAMMISVTVDKSLAEISPSQRILAIQKLSHYLNIVPSTVLLLSQTIDDNSLVANSILAPRIRRETNTYRDVNSSVSVLTWQIGCNERIWGEQFRVVKLVKKYVRDGSLSNILNLPVTQWRLVPSFNPFRIRRDTPVRNETKPSSVDDNDGDEEDDEDDYPEDENDTDADDSNNEDDLFSSSAISPASNVMSSSTPGNVSFNPAYENNEKHLVGEKRFNNWTSEEFSSGKMDPDNALQSSSFDLDNDDEQGTEIVPSGNVDSDIDAARSNVSSVYGGVTPELEVAGDRSSITTSSVSSTLNATENLTATTTIATVTRKRGTLRVNKKMETKYIEAGKPYIVQIPEDIFKDDDDGYTRNLKLTLIKPQTATKPEACSPFTTWIELNAEKQTVLMLASLDAISKLESTIIATNSANMSVNDTFVVDVRFPSTVQKVNFEMSLHFRLKEEQQLNVSLQLQLLEALAKLYGDANYNKITVRHVSCGDPFVFTWTNNTLPLDWCDNATIIRLLDVLTEEPWSTKVNKNASQILGSLITVEKITWQGRELCDYIPAARLPRPPKQNYAPILRNHIDNITAKVGELKVFRIPEDTFYDPDVNSISDLKLNLSTMDSMPVPNENWLQFDEKNREIYGLPMSRDVGTSKYQLICYENENDDEERKARHTIEVVVEPATKTPYNVEFSMTLSSSFNKFNESPLQRRTFVEKLAALFGDRDTTSIVVSGYAPGSVVVIWHNKSLPVDKCPEAEIEQLRKKLLQDTKELNEQVNQAMAPDFQATSALVTPIGVCEGGLTEFHATEVNTASQEIHAIFNGNVSHYIKEYFIEVILPVIIIVSMMMLAGIVACILYRKQRNAKWTLGDEDERRTYRNKGIPVIFQDELEERPEPTNKSPIIMKEEKPPLPPPEYQKTLPVATTALLSDFDDASYQQGSVSYSTRSADRNGSGRNKATPNYRRPPPYAPPYA